MRALTASRHRLVLLLLATLITALPVTLFAQPRPAWVSSTRMTTGDGFATLRWSVEGGDALALFRISEDYSGTPQISFTDQAEIRVFRSQPGEYRFWVQACRRLADGYPQCGGLSQQLTLRVEAGPAGLASIPEAAVEKSHVTGGAGMNSTARLGGCGPRTCN